ncbi:hypothetical protein LTR51_006261 [Lithohypha guttulata]|nr:hypothetical protein LTR51_006261 [Lithohypha guttulata]
MERPPRTWNIPPGRVSQRIQAFQDDSKSSPARAKDSPKPPTTFHPSPPVPQSPMIQPKIEELPEIVELATQPPNEEHEIEPATNLEHELRDRGHPAQRSSPIPEPENLEEVDEVLEDVRARLFSVQKIVRREQSSSSQVRDELMDELGTMLDNAIATTMSPLQIPHPLTRSSSSRRPPPMQPESDSAQPVRSQSVKVAGLARSQDRTTVPSSAKSSSNSHTESPVKLRGLTPAKPLPPPSRDERPKSATPPIALALPRLIEAERRQEQAKLLNPEVEASTIDNDRVDLPLESARSFSTAIEWPGRLPMTDVGPSNPTVRQSVSYAEAAKHDEHHVKPRSSVVKTTIRDLLSATKRRVSGKSASTTKEDKVAQPIIWESEIVQSAGDLQDMTLRDVNVHLPHLQATPDEVKELQSLDGTDSNKAVEPFAHKFDVPSKTSSLSPIKPTPFTPVRGRPREAHSPGGRPYAIDHRFNLSPSRSNSRGSRGSVTFNIKARVSPGRGLGKDDTELFVTANIESDHSDEGN